MIHKIKITNLKQYKVTVTQTKVYNLTIDAEDPRNAERIALLAVSTDQGDVIDEYVNVDPV
jgi:hypothetical protein